jgi:ribosome-binding protein aMBF1 (putative translation factor)
MSLETQLVQAFGGLLCASVTAGIGVITPKIKKFLETHTTAKTATVANNVLDGLSKITESVVSDFNQRVVNDSKSKGAWTPQLAEQIKMDAVAAIKNQGSSFIRLAEKTAGDMEPLISTLIEQAVSKAKGNK